MAGLGVDTSILTINVVLDDGSQVVIVGEDDGVNGLAWSADHDDRIVPVTVRREVLIDGIELQEQQLWPIP